MARYRARLYRHSTKMGGRPRLLKSKLLRADTDTLAKTRASRALGAVDFFHSIVLDKLGDEGLDPVLTWRKSVSTGARPEWL